MVKMRLEEMIRLLHVIPGEELSVILLMFDASWYHGVILFCLCTRNMLVWRFVKYCDCGTNLFFVGVYVRVMFVGIEVWFEV